MAAPKFDPSKPFEKVAPPEFDASKPFEQVAEAAPTAGSAPSALASAGRGFVQGGTMGFGDELGGGLQAGLQALTNLGTRHPGLADALEHIGIEAHYGPESVAGTYRAGRDEMRSQDTAAMKAHPLAFGGGALAGGIATARPFASAAGALGLGGSGLAGALKTGTAMGAAAGLGTSTAEDVPGMASDAAGISGARQAVSDLSHGNYGAGALNLLGSGALGGALATVGGYGLGKAITPAMERLAIKTGRRALTNGARQLANREPVSEDAVRAALESGAMRPLGTTETTHQALEHLLGHDVQYPASPAAGTPMAAYGALIDALEANGAKGAAVGPLADTLEQRAGSLRATTGANKNLSDLYGAEAQNVRDIAPVKPRRVGVDGSVNPKEPNLGLRQAEALKRDLQSQAKFDRTTDTRINTHKKQISGIVREANERAVADSAAAQPENAQLQALNNQFIPAKQLIGNLSEAEQAAHEGAMRGAHRGTFNLPEQMETMQAIGEGDSKKLMATIAHALARPFGPTTLASTAYAARRPDVIAQLAALLQRSEEVASPKQGVTTQAPIRRDEKGRPILTIHTGPQ